MFDKDDDIDGADPSTTQDAEGNARQKAFLRKIYKFNRPNDTSSIPSNIPHNVSTSPLMSQPTINVTDKQTNTEATIAVIRPKDLNRGVWPSMNAYGGISYRPLIQPQMVSRFIQVLPHEIEQTMQPQQVIYQVVAPAAAIPPQQIQSRIIQIPAEQSSSDFLQYIETTQQQQQQPRTIQIPVQQQQIVEYVQTTQRQQQPRTIQIPAQQPQTIEYVETTQRQQPRMIQIPAPQSPLVEYIETTQKQQPRTTIIRQPQTQQIVVQPSTRIEYVDSEDQQTHRIVQQPTTRIEYVNAKDQRTHRNVQQPQYEIVEEIIDRSSPSPMDEYVEVVDAPKHGRHREKKKDKKRGFGKIIVKHIRSDND